MSDDRPSAYTEGKISIYRASAAGNCITQLVAAKLGYNEDRFASAKETLDNAAREGTLQEDIIVQTLKEDYGWRVWGSQDENEVRVIPRVILRGHTDGFCLPKKARKERLLEVKTMSDARFKKWIASGNTVKARLQSEEFYSYGVQISIYMKAHDNQSVMYVVKNRNSGKLDIEELEVPSVDWRESKKKIIEAKKWSKKEDLPPCVGSSGDKYFCPFPYLHDGDAYGDEPDEDAPIFDTATEALLSGMAEHYADLAGQVKLLKPLDEERKEIGKKMIEALPITAESTDKSMLAGGFRITRVDGGNAAFDLDKAAAVLEIDPDTLKDVLENTKTERPYAYVRVTKLKGSR